MDSGSPSKAVEPVMEASNDDAGCREKKNKAAKAKRAEKLSVDISLDLKSFTLFPKLPIEIRRIIWRLTLQSRVIEIEFHEDRGFFTRVKLPVALKVSYDSRKAVLSSYQLCFGNVIYTPRILFNFSLDTLYLDNGIQHHLLHFLGSLKPEEAANLQRLAVDQSINLVWEWGGEMDIDCFSYIKKAIPVMSALQKFWVVYDLEHCAEGGIPCGKGPMELFKDKWPEKLKGRHFCDPDGYCCDDMDFVCEYHDLPDSEEDLTGLKAPMSGSIWGWRPLED